MTLELECACMCCVMLHDPRSLPSTMFDSKNMCWLFDYFSSCLEFIVRVFKFDFSNKFISVNLAWTREAHGSSLWTKDDNLNVYLSAADGMRKFDKDGHLMWLGRNWRNCLKTMHPPPTTFIKMGFLWRSSAVAPLWCPCSHHRGDNEDDDRSWRQWWHWQSLTVTIRYDGDVNQSAQVKLQFKIDLIQPKMIYWFTSTLSHTIHIYLPWVTDLCLLYALGTSQFSVTVLRWEHSARPADFMNAPVIYEVGPSWAVGSSIRFVLQ